MSRVRAALLLLGLAVVCVRAIGAQQPLAAVDALLQRAAADGQLYLQTKDDRAKKAAKESLDAASNQLKSALNKDQTCEGCVERQVTVEYYRAYFGFSRNYDETLDGALAGLQKFPRNPGLLYFGGLAHYNKSEFDRATILLGRFVSASVPGTPSVDQAKQLLADSRQRFLGGWYKQSNFYQSPESRIERYNPQLFKNETVLQYTPEWELGLGGQALTALTAEAPTLQDPAVSAYLTQLVRKLTDKTPGPPFTYQVRVLDSPQINAVTPPGHIIVYSGLLRFVESEAQLAAVLAHELAHNYGHHSARRFTKAYQAEAVTAAITQAVNPQSATSQLILKLSTSLGAGLFLKAYSRQEEKEADLYGSHILFNAGYSATELPAFFARLYELNPKQPVKLFSTHPPAPDRVDYLTDYIEAFPLDRESKVSTEEFEKIKLVFPSPSPRANVAGGVNRGVAPILPGAQPVVAPPVPSPTPVATPPAPPATPPSETVTAAAPPPISANLSGSAGLPPSGTSLFPPSGLPPAAPSRDEAKPTPAVQSACTGFVGQWETTRGPMTIATDGDRLRGTFPGGEFRASVTDKVLEGRWLIRSGTAIEAGPMVLRLQSDGSWKGTWGRDGAAAAASSPWDGRCVKR
jgi:hypothetical protein